MNETVYKSSTATPTSHTSVMLRLIAVAVAAPLGATTGEYRVPPQSSHLTAHAPSFVINQMVKYESKLDAVFAALAHPARRAMLARLGKGEATVGELGEPLDMSFPAVTKHLKVLERAKLISRSKSAQWRPCRLEAAPLHAASGWIDEQREIWEARLDRLEGYLHKMKKDGGK